MAEGGGEGKRELKKQRTRRRIAETAIRLFAARGFEAVTVAEIARAAGVTEKTVFNHFDTKEDLVYSNDLAFEAALQDCVRTRPQGESLLAAVQRFLLDIYKRIAFDTAGLERARTLAGLAADSPALRVRERQIHARYADVLCELIATEQRAAPDDIRPRVAAEALISVHRETIATMRNAIEGGVPADELDERIVTTACRGFTLLARGLGDYAVRGRSPGDPA